MSQRQAVVSDQPGTAPASVQIGLDRVARREANLRFLAIALWLTACTLIAATLLIWAGRGFPRSPASFARGPLGTSAIAMTGLVYTSVAVLLLNRLPRSSIGWIFLLIGLGMAVIMPVNLALSDGLRSFRPVPNGGLLLAWGITSMQIPASGALLVIVLLLFPSGRPDWRHFRAPAVLAVLGCVLMTAASMLDPDGLLWYPTLPNPAATPASWEPVLVAARLGGMACLLVALLLAIGRLVERFRRGGASERRQLGWILLGGLAMVSTLGPLFAVRYGLGAPDEVGERIVFIAAVGGVLFPISVAVAASREQLFGIEGIVARTLVYVPLMAILGGMYTASVALLNRIFVAITGTPSDAAIVMSTLLLAAALTPVRKSLEGLVERNTRGRVAAAAAALEVDPAHEALQARVAALEWRLAEIDAERSRLTESDAEQSQPAVAERAGESAPASDGEATPQQPRDRHSGLA